MLDPRAERQHQEERRKRVRAVVLADRLREARDAAAGAAERRGIVRILKWKPVGMRYRLLLPLAASFGGALLGTLIIGPCVGG